MPVRGQFEAVSKVLVGYQLSAGSHCLIMSVLFSNRKINVIFALVSVERQNFHNHFLIGTGNF